MCKLPRTVVSSSSSPPALSPEVWPAWDSSRRNRHRLAREDRAAFGPAWNPTKCVACAGVGFVLHCVRRLPGAATAKQSVFFAARPVSTGRHDALGGGEPKRFYRRPTGVSTGRTRRAGRAVKNPTIAPRLASRPRRYSWDEGVYTGAAVTLGGASRGGAFAVDFAMNRRRATLQLAELQARARTLLCFFARIAFSPPPASELSFPNQRRAGRVEKCLAARANTHRVPPPVSNKKWCARVCGACACVRCSAARSATAGSTSARGA